MLEENRATVGDTLDHADRALPGNPVRPPLGGCSLSLTENLDRGRAIAHPCLGYLHLQLRGAVLLQHRVGQLLQKTIVRAHQLPRQKADD